MAPLESDELLACGLASGEAASVKALLAEARVLGGVGRIEAAITLTFHSAAGSADKRRTWAEPHGILLGTSGRRCLIDKPENTIRGSCIEHVWRAWRDGERSDFQARQAVVELTPSGGAIDTLVYAIARSAGIEDVGVIRDNHQGPDRRANIGQTGQSVIRCQPARPLSMLLNRPGSLLAQCRCLGFRRRGFSGRLSRLLAE